MQMTKAIVFKVTNQQQKALKGTAKEMQMTMSEVVKYCIRQTLNIDGFKRLDSLEATNDTK